MKKILKVLGNISVEEIHATVQVTQFVILVLALISLAAGWGIALVVFLVLAMLNVATDLGVYGTVYLQGLKRDVSILTDWDTEGDEVDIKLYNEE